IATAGQPGFRLEASQPRRVAEDYLVSFETNRYSVPFTLIGQTVEVTRARRPSADRAWRAPRDRARRADGQVPGPHPARAWAGRDCADDAPRPRRGLPGQRRAWRAARGGDPGSRDLRDAGRRPGVRMSAAQLERLQEQMQRLRL